MSDDKESSETTAVEVPAGVTIDVAKYTGHFITLRDKIKAMKADAVKACIPFEEAKAKVEGLLLGVLQQVNGANIKSPTGTIGSTVMVSAPMEDPAAFKAFVIANQAWHLVDWKANVEAVQAYVTENKVLPPGLKMTQFIKLTARKPTKKA